MIKNIIIFLLIALCAAQSYVIYSQNSDDWLENSVNQVKNGFETFVNPSQEAKPVATTTISNNANSTSEVVSTTKTTIKEKIITEESSFAFKHLDANVDCSNQLNKIEKAICEDVDLIDQDKRLNFIVSKWEKSTKENEFKITSQDEWLKLRTSTCSSATDASVNACIKALTEKRIQAITGQI